MLSYLLDGEFVIENLPIWPWPWFVPRLGWGEGACMNSVSVWGLPPPQKKRFQMARVDGFERKEAEYTKNVLNSNQELPLQQTCSRVGRGCLRGPRLSVAIEGENSKIN